MNGFEIHTITSCGEDLGVMTFENGELAVYPTAKIAKRVADGMNRINEKFSSVRHTYIVKEAKQND